MHLSSTNGAPVVTLPPSYDGDLHRNIEQVVFADHQALIITDEGNTIACCYRFNVLGGVLLVSHEYDICVDSREVVPHSEYCVMTRSGDSPHREAANKFIRTPEFQLMGSVTKPIPSQSVVEVKVAQGLYEKKPKQTKHSHIIPPPDHGGLCVRCKTNLRGTNRCPNCDLIH